MIGAATFARVNHTKLTFAAALASLLIAQACGDDGQITSTIQDQNCMNDLQCETACEGIVCMDRPVFSAVCDPEQELCVCVCE